MTNFSLLFLNVDGPVVLNLSFGLYHCIVFKDINIKITDKMLGDI